MNKKQLLFFWSVIFFVSAIVAISSADKLKEYSNQDEVIVAKTGEEFIITLESNRTTGFQWQLIGPLDNNIIQLVSSEYKAKRTNLLGSGGKEIWIFKAVGVGKTSILFKYSRSWEKDVLPAKQMTFVVEVNAS